MATFSNIGLEEPSTITHRAATVDINRGGTVEQQEILVIGDPESSLGVAGVLDTTPASTQYGLVVREAEPTTSVRVHQSSAGDLNVTVAGYVAPTTGPLQISSVGGLVQLPSTQQVAVSNQSTTVNVSSLGGAVITRSSAANSLHTVYQSSAADLNVTVAGYVAPSTTIAISSGVIQAQQITSSGANMTDSTQASLRVTVVEQPAGGSTQVAISSGVVQVQNITSSGADMTDSTETALRVNVVAGGGVGSTQVSISSGVVQGQLITSSGADITDSTQASIRVTIAEGAASGSTQVAISSGVVQVQHITSSGAQMTTNTTPASTAYGLITRLAPSTVNVSSVAGRVLVDQNSTVWPVQVSSVAGQVSVVPVTSSGLELTTNATPGSTAEGLIVRQVDYTAPSTTVNVSTVAGRVLVDQNSTVWPVQVSSVAGTVQTQPTAALQSSGDPVIGQAAALVEANPINSTYVSGTLSSAESTIVAAISTSALCVYSLAITLPPTSSQTVRFIAASTNEKWRVFFHSTVVSAGAVEAVTPPQYLFKTAANQSLALTSSGGTANVTYSIGYFEEG